MSCSVAIIEDNPEFLDKFVKALALAAEFSLFGVATDGAQGMALVDCGPADIYLVDLGLPDMRGTAVIRHAIQRHPECDVMVVTVFGDDANIMESIEAGATGYILKDCSTAEMLAALRTLREGGASVSPLIARKILERLRFNPPLPESIKRPDIVGDTVLEIAGLTQREIEILQILARGHSFNEIGAQMFISAHTVARHVKNIYRKLTVHSRGEAVYAAARMGLL